jgi:hypothetical protein
MNINDVKENQLVERYLQGKLSDQEQEAFEEFYLSNPETLEALELAEKLQRGLQEAAASGYDSEYQAPGFFQSILGSPQYAMAASVLMLFSFGLSGVLYQQLQSSDTGPDAFGPTVGQSLFVPMIEATRSGPEAEPPNLVRIEDPQAWFAGSVNLGVDQGFTEYAVYRATVSRDMPDGPAEVLRIVGLEPGAGLPVGYEEMLSIEIPGRILPPGDYRILLEGSPDDAGVDLQFTKINETRFRISE